MSRGTSVVLLAALAAGCAHAPAAPGDALSAFGAALARHDLRAAYGMTSAELRRRMPFEAFAAGLEGPGGETAALGQRIVSEAGRVPPRLDLELALGERVALVFEDGAWRVDGPVYEPWGQQTPRAALRTFVRAIDAHRYDVVLRLVPDRLRGGLTAERLRSFWEGSGVESHRQILTKLRAAAVAPLVESGDEAHVPLGDDGEVRLAREPGGWKIETLGEE